MSRTPLLVGVIASLSLLGCASAITPDASSPRSSKPAGSSNPVATGPSHSAAPTGPAAAWIDAGSLVQPRNATNVAVIGKGEVLVVGDDNICYPASEGSDSVELGDPATGVWEATASLRSPRDGPVLVGLPDGRALLTGGLTGENEGPAAYSSTYVFDPTNQQWSRSGLLNTARTGAAAAVLDDGRVLVAGGLYIDHAQNQRDLDSSELWDPATGAWTRTGELAGTRIDGSAVTLSDGRVLVVGGVGTNSDQIQQVSAEIYDPTSGEWSPAGRLANARVGFALAAVPGGGAIVAGGSGAGGEGILSTVERYDPVTATWAQAEPLLVPVTGASGVALADGRVLIAGGSDRQAEVIDPDSETFVTGLTTYAELFDPASGTWSATAPLPSPRGGASAVLLPDGSAVVAGGYGSEGDMLFSAPGCFEPDRRVYRYVPGS